MKKNIIAAAILAVLFQIPTLIGVLMGAGYFASLVVSVISVAFFTFMVKWLEAVNDKLNGK